MTSIDRSIVSMDISIDNMNDILENMIFTVNTMTNELKELNSISSLLYTDILTIRGYRYE
jgi:archaellum component FlaC